MCNVQCIHNGCCLCVISAEQSSRGKKMILITLHRIDNNHKMRQKQSIQLCKTSINRTVIVFLMKNQNKFQPQTTEKNSKTIELESQKRRLK